MTEKKMTRPNYFENDDPTEITLYARDLGKTGSKQLHQFSAKIGTYRVGDEFENGGRRYIVERIEELKT